MESVIQCSLRMDWRRTAEVWLRRHYLTPKSCLAQISRKKNKLSPFFQTCDLINPQTALPLCQVRQGEERGGGNGVPGRNLRLLHVAIDNASRTDRLGILEALINRKERKEDLHENEHFDQIHDRVSADPDGAG